LVGVLITQGERADAETVLRELLPVMRRVLGSEHPRTLVTNGNMAHVLAARGKYAKAETMLCEVLEVQE